MNVNARTTKPPASHLNNTMNNIARLANGGSSDIGAMDDLQFDASLDALLDSENLDDTTTGTVQDSTQQQVNLQFQAAPMMAPITTGLGGHIAAASTSCAAQGFLGTSPTASLGVAMQLPFTVSDSQSSLAGHAVNTGLAGVNVGQPYSATYSCVPGLLQMPPPPPPGPMALAQQQQRQQPPLQSRNVVSATPPLATIGKSSMTAVAKSTSTSSLSSTRKRTREITEVSEDEEDRDKRRHDRNLREQQRSHKITQRIAELRDVLAAANIQFKPDKYSTLVKVADYIKQLQSRSALLDQEHQKLLNTIAKTNEIVNNQYMPASTTGENPPGSNGDIPTSPDVALSAEEADAMVFVRGIDYKSVFSRCGVPLAVASIDGRLLDCNKEFEKLTSFTREELLPREIQVPKKVRTDTAVIPDTSTSSSETAAAAAAPSSSPQTDTNCNPSIQRNLSLFNLLCREDMEDVFKAMSEMLKTPNVSTENDKDKNESSPASTETGPSKDFWTGIVRLSRMREVNMRMSVALVRSPLGRAKFFDCSLYPLTDNSQPQVADTSQQAVPGNTQLLWKV